MTNNVGVKFEFDKKIFDKLFVDLKSVQKLVKSLKIDTMPGFKPQQFYGMLSGARNLEGSFNKTLLKNFIQEQQIKPADLSALGMKLPSTYKGLKSTSMDLKKQSKFFLKEEMAFSQLQNKLFDTRNQALSDFYKNSLKLDKGYSKSKINLDNQVFKNNEAFLKDHFVNLKYQGQVEMMPFLKRNQALKDSFEKAKKYQKDFAVNKKSTQEYILSQNKINKLQDKFNQKLYFGSNIQAELGKKVKTLLSYYGVVQGFLFLKDIVQTRREFELNIALMSNAISKFDEFKNVSGSALFTASTNIINDLKSFANELGIKYGEINEGFAKILNAIPEGTLSIVEATDSYKEMLKLFKMTGATADEQTVAIRAFYQMLEKGTVTGEEFTKQLGNTPVRAQIMSLAIKKYSNQSIKSSQDLIAYLKSAGISSAQFFKDIGEQAKKEGGNISSFTKNIDAQLNRLSNAFDNFKLSFTGGIPFLSQLSPVLGTLSSTIGTLTLALNTLSVLTPFATLFFTLGYSATSASNALSFFYKSTGWTLRTGLTQSLKLQTQAIETNTQAVIENAKAKLIAQGTEKKYAMQLAKIEGEEFRLAENKKLLNSQTKNLARSFITLAYSAQMFMSSLQTINDESASGWDKFIAGTMLAINAVTTLSSAIEGIQALRGIKFLLTGGLGLKAAGGLGAIGILGMTKAAIIFAGAVVALIAVIVLLRKLFAKENKPISQFAEKTLGSQYTSFANAPVVSTNAIMYTAQTTYISNQNAGSGSDKNYNVNIATNLPIQDKFIKDGNMNINLFGRVIQPLNNLT